MWGFVFLILSFGICNSVAAESPNYQLRGGEIQSHASEKYGRVEIRLYSQNVIGTTSTFFWWREGGHNCGTKWNEIDIETIPAKSKYQSNVIWETFDYQCGPDRIEKYHGDSGIFDRWVVYILEWTPDYIAWYHDGQLDRKLDRQNFKSFKHITEDMKYCFNLWTEGNANPDWLGNLDFDTLKYRPVYQFVDYFKYYKWNGHGFNTLPSTNIDFSDGDIERHFRKSSWDFIDSKGFLSWSEKAVGVSDLGSGNKALWLGLFYAGYERPPRPAEIPRESYPSWTLKIEAESAEYSSGLRIEGQVLSYIEDGAWASYKAVNIPRSGQYVVTYRTASGGAGGSVQLERAGGNEVFGYLRMPSTGSWSKYTFVSHTVTIPAGTLNIGLNFPKGGFNLDNFIIKLRK